LEDLAFELGIPEDEVAREQRRFVLHRLLEPRRMIVTWVLSVSITILTCLLFYLLSIHFGDIRLILYSLFSTVLSIMGSTVVNFIVSTYFDDIVEKRLDAEFESIS